MSLDIKLEMSDLPQENIQSSPDISIYQVGGTVPFDTNKVYIEREADRKLLKHCRNGDYCHVLTTRQLGKSSLITRTAWLLSKEGFHTVIIDLQQLGTSISLDQWYLGMLDEVAEKLPLGVDYLTWWKSHEHLGRPQRLIRYMHQVVLSKINGRIIIFIDEIENVLAFDKPNVDFFHAIRHMFNARASNPDFRRMAFVLVGAARPTDLINNPDQSPFNIGEGVELTDFTLEETMPLAKGLRVSEEQATRAMKAIMNWTGGHPYLTQVVCKDLANHTKIGSVEKEVTALVEKRFLQPHRLDDFNMQYVRDRLTLDKNAIPGLRLLFQIHSGQPTLNDDRNALQTYLKLVGIVRTQGNVLSVRNKIYDLVFDTDWIEEALKKEGAVPPSGITKHHASIEAMEGPQQVEVERTQESDKTVTTKPGPVIDEEKPPTGSFFGSVRNLYEVLMQLGNRIKNLRSRRKIKRRLQELATEDVYSESRDLSVSPPPFTAIEVVDDVGEVIDTEELAGRMDDILDSQEFWMPLKERIERAGLSVRISEYFVFVLTCSTVAFFISYNILFPNQLLLSLILGFVGLQVPRTYLNVRSAQRINAFQKQLPLTIDVWMNALRSGYSVLQAWEHVSTNSSPPTSIEFYKVVTEVRLGLGLEQTLANLYRRMPDQTLDKLIVFINVQREIGGNLSEALNLINIDLGLKQRLIDRVASSVHSQFSIFITVSTAMLAVQWGLFPEYFSLAWQKPSGQLAMFLTYAILTIGMLYGSIANQRAYNMIVKLGRNYQYYWKYIGLDLVLGMIYLFVVTRLSVPIEVVCWLALMMLFRIFQNFPLVAFLLCIIVIVMSKAFI